MVEFLVNQLIMNNKDEEHVIVSIEGYRLETYLQPKYFQQQNRLVQFPLKTEHS